MSKQINYREYKVLVVDDKHESLNRISAICNNSKVEISGQTFLIKILPLKVDIDKSDNDNYKVSNTTLNKLIEYSQHKLNLILMDFGFRHPEVNVEKENETMVTEDGRFFNGKLLSPMTLVVECKKRIHENKTWKTLKRNFIDFKGNLFVYTFIPSGIETKATQINVRENNVRSVFKECNIISIDSRSLFFNNEDEKSDGSSKFYPYILSQYLYQIIQLEISNLLNSESKKSYRLLKTSRNIFLIGVSCTGIGIFSGILSNWAILFFKLGQIGAAIVMPLTSIIIISFIGAIFLKSLENKFLTSKDEII